VAYNPRKPQGQAVITFDPVTRVIPFSPWRSGAGMSDNNKDKLQDMIYPCITEGEISSKIASR